MMMLVSSLSFSPLPPSPGLLKEHIGYMRSRSIRTFETQGETDPIQDLEKADELLCSCNRLGPWLLLVLVRISPLFLRSPPSIF